MSRLWPALAVLALTPACSQPSADPANSANTQSNAASSTISVPPAPAAADWRQLAECSSKLEAVARLYSAIAGQGNDAQSQEMFTRSLDRQSAAMRFQERANRAAAPSPAGGGANPEVERIRTETAARLESERGRRPFEDFAIWLGREADGCAPLDTAPQP